MKSKIFWWIVGLCWVGTVAGCGWETAELEVELLETGFGFTEGPTFDEVGGAVFFSDQPNDVVYRWALPSAEHPRGWVESVAGTQGRANGLAMSADGNLYACADGANRLVRWLLDSTGLRQVKETVLAEGYGGNPLNGPNDLWLAPDGSVLFTDPFYERPYWEKRLRTIESHQGSAEQQHVYRWSARGGVERAAEGLQKPNGLVGNRKGTMLWVADAAARKVYRYQLRQPEVGRLLLEEREEVVSSSGSDGLARDAEERLLFLTRNHVVAVHDSSTGVLLREIPFPERPSNIVFVGCRLFVTAETSVYLVSPTGHSLSNLNTLYT